MRDDRPENQPPQHKRLLLGWLAMLSIAATIIALGYIAKHYM